MTETAVEGAPSMIDRLNEAAERMEKANARTAELLERQESLAVQGVLGGRTSASLAEKPVVSPEEYARRVSRGENPE